MSAQELINFRSRYRLSQTELGNILGRARGTVASWEAGSTSVDPGALARVAELRNADPELVQRAALPRDSAAAGELSKWLRNAETGTRSVNTSSDPLVERWHVNKLYPRRDAELADLVRVSRAAMSTADLGSFIAPGPMPAGPLSALALDSRLARLGARYLPTLQPIQDNQTAIWVDDFTPEWLLEGAEVTQQAAPLREVMGPACTVGAGVAVSRRLMKLTGDAVAEAVAGAVVRALTRAVDAAALAGAGLNGEPLGLAQSPAVPVLSAQGSFDADTWRLAIETLEGQGVDADRLSVVAPAATKKILSGISFDMGSLWRQTPAGQTCGGCRAMVGAVPDDTFLVGDFSRLLIQHSERVQLVMRETNASGERELFAFFDVCIHVPQPTAFLKVEHVTN